MKYKLLSDREEQIARQIVDEMKAVWKAQVLSHLKLLGKRHDFLINFNVVLIKDGIKRLNL